MKEELLDEFDMAPPCIPKRRLSAVRSRYLGAASVVCHWLGGGQAALCHSAHLVGGSAAFPADLACKRSDSEPLIGRLVKLAQYVVIG